MVDGQFLVRGCNVHITQPGGSSNALYLKGYKFPFTALPPSQDWLQPQLQYLIQKLSAYLNTTTIPHHHTHTHTHTHARTHAHTQYHTYSLCLDLIAI